jgi:hypothetical protein
MAAVMTFASLTLDLQNYPERADATYVANIPRFIMQAENRIAAEARGLGFITTMTANLVVGQQQLAKPARWRETVSFNIGIGTGNSQRKFLLQRPYELLRVYAPDPTTNGQPKYYADWDYYNWLIAPTPDFAYPFEVIAHQRPQPLDSANLTNWTTEFAPQLLLSACLLEAQSFLKRDDRIQVYQEQYDRALKQVSFEQKRRLADRTQAVQGA